MRIRTVKPEFWQHRMHKKLSEPAVLLALALLNYVDDDGRFEADADWIGAQLFRYRPLSKPLEDCLQELVACGWVTIYSAQRQGEEVRMGVVTKFRKHQRIDRPSPSRLPEPPHGLLPDDARRTPRTVAEDSTKTPRTLDAGSGSGNREEERETRARETGDGFVENKTTPPRALDEPSRNGPGEAEIPSVLEVIAFGALGAGIPADYCRHYHEEKTIRHSWVIRGQLVQWRVEVVKWWNKDRNHWKKNPAAAADREALLAELETETDPERRRELQRQLGY
jgi:hypothetical protein